MKRKVAADNDKVVEWQRKQHAVKEWIEALLGVEIESEQLHQPLKSGFILCRVIRKLDANAIPRIQEDATQIFKLKENIDFFIAACEDLGLPPYRRFKAPELFDNTNMVNVIESLAALAQLVERDFEGAPGLHIDSTWKPPTLSDNEIKTIKAQLAKLRDKPVSGQRYKISSAIVLKKLELMAGNGVDSY